MMTLAIFTTAAQSARARLEPLAEPGGICVSSIVNESVGNRIDVLFRDGGEISVKNIDRPIRVWKWHPSATTSTAARSHAANSAPNIAAASIAVLPLTNMSGDPEQEYFSDGISEDIITNLSKIAGLSVIAQISPHGRISGSRVRVLVRPRFNVHYNIR
jgi:adenylate cyclase